MKSFEILHLSYRDWPSYHDKGCYNLNLVFRIFDLDFCEETNTKERFLNESKEWQKTEIVTDLELAEKYIQGLRVVHKNTGRDILECPYGDKPIPIEFVNDNGIERSDVYIKGYTRNWNSMLTYNKKFDCFRFSEYFLKGPVTDGIITMIEQLRTIEEPDECASEDLLRCIKSLEFWWD